MFYVNLWGTELLACNASAYGVGAVISHQMSDGLEKPTAYASHILSKLELNYSQIEKEALGIIFGVQKFRDYLCGQYFLDHQPLIKFLGPKTGLYYFTIKCEEKNYSVRTPTDPHHKVSLTS